MKEANAFVPPKSGMLLPAGTLVTFQRFFEGRKILNKEANSSLAGLDKEAA